MDRGYTGFETDFGGFCPAREVKMGYLICLSIGIAVGVVVGISAGIRIAADPCDFSEIEDHLQITENSD